MTDYLFPPTPVAALTVEGESATYPVRRIFCVGRNYAAHAAEMGAEVDREAPWYFTKSPCHLAHGADTARFAAQTEEYHHEVELYFAMGAEAAQVPVEGADALIYGYGVGLDMTRRDLQAVAKSKSRPWDTAKDVEDGAILGVMTKAGDAGITPETPITLTTAGTLRQTAVLGDMVWSPAEIISHLSYLYRLGPGDVIMTGTPAGVGPVAKGDRLEARVDGLPPLDVTLV